MLEPPAMITMDDNDIADSQNENNDPLLSNLNVFEDNLILIYILIHMKIRSNSLILQNLMEK